MALFKPHQICLVLTLVLVVGLFTTGAFGDPGCGNFCCCRNNLIEMGHSPRVPGPKPADSCNIDSVLPCNSGSGRNLEPPDFIPTSRGGRQWVLSITAETTADFLEGSVDPGEQAAGRFECEIVSSPPIYLLKTTFLI